MSEKINVAFLTFPDGEELGKALVPFSALEQLKLGDVLRFKESARIYGPCEIRLIAVNEGLPEGCIHVKVWDDVKERANIKLREINEEALDKRLPF